MDSQWLKTQFELNPDRSKADLARALSLEPPAISKILNGTRQVKATEYTIMRRFFGLPVDGEQAVSAGANSYVMGTLEGEEALKEGEQENGTWAIPADILAKRTKAPPEQIKIFKVSESVMEPDFKQGEHVVVDLSDKRPSPPGTYVVSDGFGYMIRQCAYVPRSSPPEIKLTAIQKSFQPQTLKEEEFNIIGRVMAKLQWV